MEPAVVEPESLPACAQVLKWNLGAAKDVQSVLSCTEKPQSVASSTVTFFAKTLKFGVGVKTQILHRFKWQQVTLLSQSG